MIGLIDTSSLVAIARYYLSIKDEVKLLRFIESKFRSGKLILLRSIHIEASRTQKRIAVELMEFLNDDKLIFNDSYLTPPSPKKFSNQLDNNLCVPLQKKKLSAEIYALQKEQYMSTGDARMILYALNNMGKEPVIITEETMLSNDGKLFKKLPAICEFLNIKHMTIAEWLVANGITLDWTHTELAG